MRKLFKFSLHKRKLNEEIIWIFQAFMNSKKNSCRGNYMRKYSIHSNCYFNLFYCSPNKQTNKQTWLFFSTSGISTALNFMAFLNPSYRTQVWPSVVFPIAAVAVASQAKVLSWRNLNQPNQNDAGLPSKTTALLLHQEWFPYPAILRQGLPFPASMPPINQASIQGLMDN